MKGRLFVLMMLVSLSLSSCSGKEAEVANAVSGTLTAVAGNDTATHASETPAPTTTLTPSPSATFKMMPSLTPTPDERIIDIDPQIFLLKQEELPLEGKYYMPNSNWMSINTNEEIISNWGVDKGRDYVTRTGRIVGWFAVRKRGTRAVRMPDEVRSEVVLFSSAEGARLAVEEYNEVEAWPLDGWKYIKSEKLDVGDTNVIYMKQEMAPGGEKNTWVVISFAYRNMSVFIGGYAYNEADISYDFLEELARIELEKLENALLEEPDNAIIAR